MSTYPISSTSSAPSTTAAQGVDKPPVAPGSNKGDGTPLPQPNERDESRRQVEEGPRDVILQAQKDLENGLVDTDMRVTPGLDAQHRDELTTPTKPKP